MTAQQEKAKKELEEKAKKLEEERKKKEKPKPDYEMARLMTQPNSMELLETSFKPGHWSSGTVAIRSNNKDFLGDLVTQPLKLDGMPFDLGTSRPAVLAKGQVKHLEMTFYVPPGKRGQFIRTRLLQRGGQEVVGEDNPASPRMPDFQFYFFVLAADPDRYAFIKDLDSVRPPTGRLSSGPGDMHYRVMLPKVKNRTPLPSNPLCWTSMAYMLWDDLHPDVMTPDQQQALLDWLHWGGQLIVSGPGTLEALRGSFLEPFLPATAGDNLELPPDIFAELNQTWTLHGLPLKPARLWSGVALELAPDAVTLLSGNNRPLVVERQVGRGRIVVSAFRLNQRELVSWKSFDGFFNNCLLRRPARHFTAIDGGLTVVVNWENEAPTLDYVRGDVSTRDDWRSFPILNPQHVSAVRFFARDTEIDDVQRQDLYGLESRFSASRLPRKEFEQAMSVANQTLQGPVMEEGPENISSGVAGWDDFNVVADLARQALRGGIVIPDAQFVVWVLAVYMVVLVPLNWAVFRSLGRVEWAWAAAPVITIAFAVAVVRLAQLDVGFVRTKSEVGVVELQANFPRAHVTRYTALYTSLSTTYDLRFADASAVVQPFPTRTSQLKEQTRTTVWYRRDAEGSAVEGNKTMVNLEGFTVDSNSQSMLHSEQMHDVGGGLQLESLPNGTRHLVNHSELDLDGAAVVSPEGFAWIGKLPAGAKAALSMQPLPVRNSWIEQWSHSPVSAATSPPEVLNIRKLLHRAFWQTDPGETRLVAWTDEEIPGLLIEPAASQARHANLVIAHLDYARKPAARPDKNTRAEVERIEQNNVDEAVEKR